VSALARAGRWTSRLSVGTGFFGPTPITEETEAAGLSRLEVHQPILTNADLEKIRSISEVSDSHFKSLTLEGSVASRNHVGGTAPAQVKAAVKRARARKRAR
jgi:argininosuccinate lyase